MRFRCRELPFLSAGVAASIARFIAFELSGVSALGRSLVAHFRRRAVIAVMRIERVVYVSLEVFRTMKPRTYPHEHAAGEPFRAIVTVGNAAVRSVIVVAVRAIRSHADFNADLGLCFVCGCRKHESGNSRSRKNFKSTHT